MSQFDIVLTLELVGTFAFAVSGALLAARKGFDLVGSLLLAGLAGLGGGVIRDLILDSGVPNAFDTPLYLVPVLIAVLAVYVTLIRESRLRRTLLVFDALGLSLFCVMGATIAHEVGLNPISCVLMGVTTAVGGGTLRDVVADEIPQIFNPQGVYAAPAFLGAALTTAVLELDVFGAVAGTAIVAVVLTLRLLALKFGWRIPRAAHR
ncbi:MAG: trimeric intracellular cation channel family protein [Nesterenkonia sp.]|uniref:trimeric intracellular cation channel family protein n=1 Tax=Nesterenkonia marinintestina TaxID=2979865 RepID=UPI0021BFB9D9|nr:trimeric intracellular cation channel family protein [Nesterenkonia sp. GX14115]MDO5492185.1 trimeric intracellular cation channel family protein [Nesterenkonia sp.]